MCETQQVELVPERVGGTKKWRNSMKVDFKLAKKAGLLGGLSTLALLALPTVSVSAFGADEVEEVVVVGTRREARSVGDSPRLWILFPDQIL